LPVVDLSAGSGILSRRVVEAGFRARGVDLSAEMFRIARTQARQASIVRGSLRSANLPPCTAVGGQGGVQLRDGPDGGAGAARGSPRELPCGARAGQCPAVRRRRPGARRAFRSAAAVLEPRRRPPGLKAATIGVAYQMHRDDEVGSIEEGRLADLIVIDRDLRKLFDVSSAVIDGNPQARSEHMRAVYDANVAATKTLLTMVGGKVVFADVGW
jgi:hypothetical protein